MKSKHYGLIAILAVICLICSCGGGSGSSSSDGDGVVKVSFGVDTSEGTLRTATVTNPDLISAGALVYEYNAHAEFSTTDFGTPKGDTGTEWVVFNPSIVTTDTNYEPTSILFAQGKWTIQVRVKKEGVVIYQTATTGTGYSSAGKTQYINSTTDVIEIEVEKVFTGTGKIKISDLYAPDTSGSDKLIVSYGPMGTDTVTDSVEFTAAAKATAGEGDWVGYNKYNAEITGVAAGAYWVTVAYSNGTSIVGASTVASEIINGLESTISGSIQNGIWASSNIKVVGIKKITATVSITSTTFNLNNVISLDKSEEDTLAVACSATVKDLNTDIEDTGTKYYTFCVNGARTDNTTGSFTFEAKDYAPGTYYIYCLAADSTKKVSITATPIVRIEVQP